MDSVQQIYATYPYDIYKTITELYHGIISVTAAAPLHKRLDARLPRLGSLVRVSVTSCGFCCGWNGVWVGLSLGFSRFPLAQISFHHFFTLISFISFHQHLWWCIRRGWHERPTSLLFTELQFIVVVGGLRHSSTSHVISVAFYIEREKSDKFCSKALISAWGSFTCRKCTTRDPRLYFHSEGSHTPDFYTLKKYMDPGRDSTSESRIQWASMITTDLQYREFIASHPSNQSFIGHELRIFFFIYSVTARSRSWFRNNKLINKQ